MAQKSALQKTNSQSVDVTNNKNNRRTSWTYRPNVDIFDAPDELLLLADIPGAEPESIEVSMESGILTVQADVPPRQFGAAPCVTHEYGIGGFHRRFEIDESIDTEAVSADYHDGSLTVRLPKVKQARRRCIPVSA